ncbi:MAG: BatD family protein [Proteobacteria bacterium]|nr:BatD family protein [Pseudomonadota bacterium]
MRQRVFIVLLCLGLGLPALVSAAPDTATPDTAAPDTAAPDTDTIRDTAANLNTNTAPAADKAALRDEIPADEMPEITASLSPTTVAIGDPISFRITAVRDKDDRVLLPSALRFRGLEIASNNTEESAAPKGKVQQVFEIVLVGFDVGDFVVPPQKLTVVNAAGNISEVLTQSLSVQIQSVIGAATNPELKLDEAPGEVVLEEDYTLLYALLALAIAAVVVLLTLLIRRLWAARRPKPAPPPPPPRPAEEIALEKLAALAASSYLSEGAHKAYHLALSEAFREYLGNRYGMEALEMSTTELRTALVRCALSLEHRTDIAQLLEETDLVKFARMVPQVDASKALLDQAVRLVHATTPEPPPPPSGPVNAPPPSAANAPPSAPANAPPADNANAPTGGPATGGDHA